MIAESIHSLLDQLPPLDSNGRLVGPERAKAEALFPQFLVGGAAGMAELASLLADDATDYKPRYAVHALATWAARPGAERERAAVAQGLAAALAGDLLIAAKQFVIRQLQLIGTQESIEPLGKALDNADLAFDAATALGNFGPAAAPPLRTAYATSAGRTRAAILQSLGRIGDAAALDLMKQGTGDSDADVRLVAVWALARLGKLEGIASIFAAVGRGAVPRAPGADAAFTLAEKLAAAGDKNSAREIYQRLRDTFSEPQEKHLRDAAERALKA